VEGVIDLAVWDPAARRWLIIDWKTNEVNHESAESELRSLYTPQVLAYADALRALSGAPVDPLIYSTAAGLWITISC
jgi:ATP-dependent exoDNAse (exonuclease V) beta subunit